MFWISYLPILRQIVIKYPVFLWGLPLLLTFRSCFVKDGFRFPGARHHPTMLFCGAYQLHISIFCHCLVFQPQRPNTLWPVSFFGDHGKCCACSVRVSWHTCRILFTARFTKKKTILSFYIIGWRTEIFKKYFGTIEESIIEVEDTLRCRQQ